MECEKIKEKIIEMLGKINSIWILEQILKFMENITKEG